MADTHLSISRRLPANYQMKSFGEAIRGDSFCSRPLLVAACSCLLLCPPALRLLFLWHDARRPDDGDQVIRCEVSLPR